MSNSQEIKPTDGRKGNSRKKSIPKLPVPDRERSNKPAMNTAKKNRKIVRSNMLRKLSRMYLVVR
jgi:hypothetical protein